MCWNAKRETWRGVIGLYCDEQKGWPHSRRLLMTESDWLQCQDPQAMLTWLRTRPNLSDRRLRLFACAVVRHIWQLVTDERGRRAVEVAERYAEKREMGGVERWQQYNEIRQIWDAAGANPMLVLAQPFRWATEYSEWAASKSPESEPAAQAQMLRDIFGNPFQSPPTVDPLLLGPQVTSVAEAAYEERKLPEGTLDKTRLAALADALEEVGCNDLELLGHLRSEGPHYRGCWALDLVLAKN
jgi:hypothetical protein